MLVLVEIKAIYKTWDGMGYIKEIDILVTDNVIVISFHLTIVNFNVRRMVAVDIVIRFKNTKIRFKNWLYSNETAFEIDENIRGCFQT